MATVANLYINVGAKMKPLIEGMKRGSKSVKKFRKSATKTFKRMSLSVAKSTLRVGKWLGLIGGAALAGAIVAFRKVANEIDSVAKVSAKLGIGVAELQGLHLGAKLSGIEVNTLDMALQRMTRRVAEAALGMGESQAALKELGLNAKEMAQTSPEQMLMAIADALQKVPSQADKVRLAFKLFDSEGVSMVSMLGQGSEGIQNFMDRAKELGLGLSQREAASVEAFNDSLTQLGAMIKGALQQAVVRLAPYITALSEKFSESGGFAKKFGDMALDAFMMFSRAVAFGIDIGVKFAQVFVKINTFIVSMSNDVLQLVKAMLNFADSVLKIVNLGGLIDESLVAPIESVQKVVIGSGIATSAWLNTLGSAQTGLEAMFASVQEDARQTGETVETASASFDHAANAMAKVHQEANDLEASLQNQIATFGMTSAAAEIYALKQKGAQEATLETIRALHEQLEGLEKQKDLLAEGERVFESVQTPLEKYEKEIAKLEELLDAGAINQETFTRAVAKAREGLGGDEESGGSGGGTDSIQTALGSVTLPGMQQMETTAEKSLNIEKKSYDRLGEILQATKSKSGSGGVLE